MPLLIQADFFLSGEKIAGFPLKPEKSLYARRRQLTMAQLGYYLPPEGGLPEAQRPAFPQGESWALAIPKFHNSSKICSINPAGRSTVISVGLTRVLL
jgi:hypothetical protein